MSLLETVEAQLATFRPKTPRQLAAFNVASRFDDLPHLARYLNVCDRPQAVLLKAARLAEAHSMRDGSDRVVTFFALLQQWQDQEAA